MDSMAISPLFRASIYKKPNPEFGFLNSKNNCFSFFKFNCFTKRRNFAAIPVSYRPPSYLNFPRNRCNHRIPTDLFYALMPLIQSIKDFVVVASGIRTGNVLLKDLAEKWVSSLRGCDLWEGVSDDLSGEYFHSGGIGVSLLSVTSTAKVRISPVVATLAANPTFVSGLIAWVIAQLIKIFLNFFMERKWDFRILFASGGMPSSHSALCTALTTSVALCHGVADSLFPVCLGFSLVVMYDAIGVRRHAGMQAEVLNMIIQDLFQGHPISQRKLKEFLGHTPSQVIAGALLDEGMVLALLNEFDITLSDDVIETIVDKAFIDADSKGDGKIDIEEWKEFVARNPAVSGEEYDFHI